MALADNLVSYWKFDEASGNAADSVGSITLTNANVTYSAQKINNGAVFNGTSAQFSATNPTGLNWGTGSFSIAMWVKMVDTAAYGALLVKRVNGSNAGWQIYKTAAEQIEFHISDGSNTCTATTTGAGTAATYYHIVCVRDGNTSRTYVNGSADATGNATAVGSVSNTTNLEIGNRAADSQWFSGDLDEIGTWSRALSSAEVTSLYNSGNGLSYPFPTNYPLTAGQGSFTLTGQAAALPLGRKLTAALGSFVLSGQNALFAWGRGIAAGVGSFALTLQNVAVTSARKLTAAYGSFTLSGQDAAFTSAKIMSAIYGAFSLAGQTARLLLNGGRTVYSNESKNSASYTNETKNTATFTNESKNSSSWTNEDKSQESH